VSWARDAVAAIRKIVLIEDRMETLTAQVKTLAESYTDLDRRLVRLEAKFELIEKMGAARRRALPAKSQRHRDPRKSE
jgi:predicted  nucleic acid-binding Zn-ribbon protein